MKKIIFVMLFLTIVSLSVIAASDTKHALAEKRVKACEVRALDIAQAEGTDHYFSELDICLSKK